MRKCILKLIILGALITLNTFGFCQKRFFGANDFIPDIRKAEIVIDGVGKSSYCYRSRVGEILYIYKFEIKNIYKGNDLVKLGDIYIVQDGRSGITQDGSNTGVKVSDGNDEMALNANGVNVFLTAELCTDINKLPSNFIPLDGNTNVLIAGIVINTYTSNQRSINMTQAARIGHSNFKTVDSLYSYLNSNLDFVEKKKYEPEITKVDNKPIPNKMYGVDDLTTPPIFPGGKDSLDAYVLYKMDPSLLTEDYLNNHRHIKFVVSIQLDQNGEVQKVILDHGTIGRFDWELKRVIQTDLKFTPGTINKIPVASKYSFILDLQY